MFDDSRETTRSLPDLPDLPGLPSRKAIFAWMLRQASKIQNGRLGNVTASHTWEELAAGDRDELDDDDLADEDEADDDTTLEPDGAGEAQAAPEEDYAGGPDDALGLYLRQMGSIPLLNRPAELALAKKLEHHRNRFRSAALAGTRPNRPGATDCYRLARSPIQVSDGMRWFTRKADGGMRMEDVLRHRVDRRRYRDRTS